MGINLENNSLESLDEDKIPPNLIQLYLSNNKLTRLPEIIIDDHLNLKELSLSGNPWKCDCYTLKFKKWLASKTQNVCFLEYLKKNSLRFFKYLRYLIFMDLRLKNVNNFWEIFCAYVKILRLSLFWTDWTYRAIFC